MDRKVASYRLKKAVYSILQSLTYKGNPVNVYGYFRFPDNSDNITINYDGMDVTFKAYVLLTNMTESENNSSFVYGSDLTLTIDVTTIMPQSIASELPAAEIGEHVVSVLKQNKINIEGFDSINIMVDNINPVIEDDESNFIARNIIDFRILTQQK